MPRPLKLLLVLASLLALTPDLRPASVSSADEAAAYLNVVPATNPYRDVLLRLNALSPEDRDLVKNWAKQSAASSTATASTAAQSAPQLSAAQLTLVRELAAATVAAASKPALSAADWPLIPNPAEPDNPAAIALPAVGLSRELALLTVKAAESLPPGEAVAAYAAAAQLGRQQRAGVTLVEQLTGTVIEAAAITAASKRLGEFSPEDLRQLSSAWSALRPIPSNQDTFNGEREVFFKSILETNIRPGLHAMLAEALARESKESRAVSGEKSAPTTTSTATTNEAETSPDPDTGFTRHLRLSGLIDYGDGERRVCLEDHSKGTTLAIREGGTTEGIALVRIDFARRQALVRRGTREAIIDLESKRITELPPAIDRLRRLFASYEAAFTTQDKIEPDTLEKFFARARRHPGGIDGYLDELIATYDRTLNKHLADADLAHPSPPDPSAAPLDPFLAVSLSSFGPMARRVNAAATQPVILQAAIQHRLTQLDPSSSATPPADPWAKDGSSFAIEKTPDGGFLLRSRYEVRADKPLTYKFAAPDAGFVR
ncbi:MAG: hypothetical protein RIQ79_2311 [Verrucomicrobiota bacterium]